MRELMTLVRKEGKEAEELEGIGVELLKKKRKRS